MADRRRTNVEELERLLAGGMAEGEGHDELRTLVHLASAVRDGSELPTPAPAFRERLRLELLQVEPRVANTPAARLRRSADRARRSVRASLRTAVAGAAAASLLGTAGVAAAADSAIPGDVLYGVKTLVESTRLALADSGVADGRLHLAFARERLAELEGGAARLDEGRTVALLRAMDDQAIAGAEELLTVAARDGRSEPITLVERFVTEQSERLLVVREDLPLGVGPFVADSLEVLRRIQLQVDALTDPACDCTGPALAPTAAPGVVDMAPRPDLEVVIVRPGDGPAAPVGPCGCSATAPVPPRESTTDPREPNPQPSGTEPDPTSGGEDRAGEPDEAPQDEPGDGATEDDALPLDLPSPLDEVTDDVGEIVSEVLPDEVEDALEDATDPVAEIVGDLLGELPTP